LKWKDGSGNAWLTALVILLPLHLVCFFDVGWHDSHGGELGLSGAVQHYAGSSARIPQGDYEPQPMQAQRYLNNPLSCWILWRPGPDGDFDISYEDARKYTNTCDRKVLGSDKIYDPSRGKKSSGDIIRVGP